MERPSPVDHLPQGARMALLLTQAALAGCVDAVGWLLLGGLFVSFMTGNSTQLAVALAGADWLWVARLCGVLLAFFVGVFCGALVREQTDTHHGALLFAAAALALGLTLALATLFGATTLHLLPMAFAMGLINNARRLVIGAPVGATFVTGAIVGAAQGLAQWTLGRAGPEAIAPWALSWAALTVGAVIGAALVVGLGATAGLAVPTAWAALLAGVHLGVSRRNRQQEPHRQQEQS